MPVARARVMRVTSLVKNMLEAMQGTMTVDKVLVGGVMRVLKLLDGDESWESRGQILPVFIRNEYSCLRSSPAHFFPVLINNPRGHLDALVLTAPSC